MKTHLKASLVLLAGGKGLRMGAAMPKQFIEISGQTIAQHALNPFLKSPLIGEIVIVCDPSYQATFALNEQISFAPPGTLRQESLSNGLKALKKESKLVFVHDAARPLVDELYFEELFKLALENGVAALAVPSTSTLKQVDLSGRIEKTLERSRIWEVQTPQVVHRDLLEKGLLIAQEKGWQVTDETSLLEKLNCLACLVKGNSLNIKVTTPSDLQVVQSILKTPKAGHEALLS